MNLNRMLICAFLWAVTVFLFTGRVFNIFDEEANNLENERIQIQIFETRDFIQNQLDLGQSLNKLNSLPALFEKKVEQNKEMISLFVADAQNSKILFSSVKTQEGLSIPWIDKCKIHNSFFKDVFDAKTIIGTGIFNVYNKPVGCVGAEYKTEMLEDARNKMVNTSSHYAFYLFALGCLFIFCFYVTPTVKKYIKSYKTYLIISLSVLLLSVPHFIGEMYIDFEKNLHPIIETKVQTISNKIRFMIQFAVEKGVPFNSIPEAETYLDNFKKQNPEIAFILLTDKSGRVLYEAGTAEAAFKSDSKTGQISLRNGYYNAAGQIIVNNSSIGWLQIGVNERYLREKVF